MHKIKLITDSTCDLTAQMIEDMNIKVVPLIVSFGEESYKDLEELQTPRMYELVVEKNMLPKTAAIAPGVFEECFQQYLDEGYQILYMGIGSKFSSTIQSAMIAKNMIGSDDIHIIDSANLSSGTGLLLLKAHKFIKEGDDILTVKNKVETLVPKVRSQFVIETLDYLHKGGRLNALSAFVGSMLRMHPVIKVRNGEMEVGKKAMGNIRKGLNIMINEAVEIKDDIDPEFLMITHSMAKSSYPYVKRKMDNEFNFETTYETHAGCVISTHCGEGTIGILYITK